MRRFWAAGFLVLSAPLIAEGVKGSTPISMALSLVAEIPIYGGGVLLVRELVRHRRRGWASIILLGMVYCLIEEGLVLQSFFHPTLYNAFDWGARIVGINGVYSIWAFGYHAIWSIAIPILLTDLLFPALSDRPYFGRVGLIITGIVFVLGVLLLGFITHVSIAPGYWAPPALLILTVLTVIVLGIVALFVLPPRVTRDRLQSSAPSPWLVLLLGGIAGFLWQLVLMSTSHFFPALVQGALVLIPVVVALALVAVVIWLLNSWTKTYNWGKAHLLALVSGALIAHTVFGILFLTDSMTELLGQIILGLLITILLVLCAFRLARRREQHQVNDAVQYR
ncbi:hypothetical protein [Ktedonospora formicarum]|uniref:Uncharacterized protein n=1 Tax=Ktedonospora formicarum TaxID=2778364 RepID=A0A8J3MXA6_9CHLR|nr:hypothetical protein [Ktedonospora formicarum]GHO49781.1 hypothetical protein KSX_79440 [Ktedonospora formicarum]